MKRLFVALFVAVIAHSCVFIRKDDSIDLGNNYRYIQEAPQTIIYHKTTRYEGTGINIIPPVVLSYKFNDRYIIAKSQEIDETTGSKDGFPIKYWVVDKSTNGAPVETIDYITFYQRLKELNINLNL